MAMASLQPGFQLACRNSNCGILRKVCSHTGIQIFLALIISALLSRRRTVPDLV